VNRRSFIASCGVAASMLFVRFGMEEKIKMYERKPTKTPVVIRTATVARVLTLLDGSAMMLASGSALQLEGG